MKKYVIEKDNFQGFLVASLNKEAKKPLHRFRVRAIEMILNDIEKKGFASVFYPYNFVKDIKQYYGIDVKVDESLRIVYTNKKS